MSVQQSSSAIDGEGGRDGRWGRGWEWIKLVTLFYCSRGKASGMKLGKKGKDVETFVDKLVAEGESKFMCLT